MVDILVKHLPADSAHLNKRCKKVEQVSADPLLYRIHFSDGTTHEANLVIGADGIKSVARDAVLGRRVEPRYVGTRAFRGLFPGTSGSAPSDPNTRLAFLSTQAWARSARTIDDVMPGN